MQPEWKIHCLVPDLPAPHDVVPYLEEMDKNKWYSNFGPINARFEAAMADFVQGDLASKPYVATFSSATTALELALKASGMERDALVLVPGLTFPATILGVMSAGYQPVIGDVDSESWALQPTLAEALLEKHPEIQAVIPVAPFGYPLDVPAWGDFARKTGVKVIADTAASLGQQPLDPDVSCAFSLHATKPFGVGEGGLLVTWDKDLRDKAVLLSNFGFVDGEIVDAGSNAKFGEYYAAMGLIQLGRFAEITARRKAVLRMYQDRLPVGLLRNGVNSDVPPAVLPVDTKGQAKQVIAAMNAAGIQTRQWYIPALDKHRAFKDVLVGCVGENNTLTICRTLETSLVGLPFHAFLSEDDVATVCRVLQQSLQEI